MGLSQSQQSSISKAQSDYNSAKSRNDKAGMAAAHAAANSVRSSAGVSSSYDSTTGAYKGSSQNSTKSSTGVSSAPISNSSNTSTNNQYSGTTASGDKILNPYGTGNYIYTDPTGRRSVVGNDQARQMLLNAQRQNMSVGDRLVQINGSNLVNDDKGYGVKIGGETFRELSPNKGYYTDSGKMFSGFNMGDLGNSSITDAQGKTYGINNAKDMQSAYLAMNDYLANKKTNPSYASNFRGWLQEAKDNKDKQAGTLASNNGMNNATASTPANARGAAFNSSYTPTATTNGDTTTYDGKTAQAALLGSSNLNTNTANTSSFNAADYVDKIKGAAKIKELQTAYQQTTDPTQKNLYHNEANQVRDSMGVSDLYDRTTGAGQNYIANSLIDQGADYANAETPDTANDTANDTTNYTKEDYAKENPMPEMPSLPSADNYISTAADTLKPQYDLLLKQKQAALDADFTKRGMLGQGPWMEASANLSQEVSAALLTAAATTGQQMYQNAYTAAQQQYDNNLNEWKDKYSTWQDKRDYALKLQQSQADTKDKQTQNLVDMMNASSNLQSKQDNTDYKNLYYENYLLPQLQLKKQTTDNDTAKTNYQVKKPYYNPKSGKSNSKSSKSNSASGTTLDNIALPF